MQSLEEKIAEAHALLHEIAQSVPLEQIAVAWTAGKDSTVSLHLWKSVLAVHDPHARVRVLNLDTGCKFPAVIALRDVVAQEWNLDMHIARPVVSADYPLAQDKVQCCRDLKVIPLARAIAEKNIHILLTGIRADEHPDRAARPQREAHTDPVHERIHPILTFTEMDVWAYILQNSLPYCTLYSQGYRSLGCVPCTHLPLAGGGERSGRDPDKEAHLDTLHDLGYF